MLYYDFMNWRKASSFLARLTRSSTPAMCCVQFFHVHFHPLGKCTGDFRKMISFPVFSTKFSHFDIWNGYWIVFFVQTTRKKRKQFLELRDRSRSKPARRCIFILSFYHFLHFRNERCSTGVWFRKRTLFC